MSNPGRKQDMGKKRRGGGAAEVLGASRLDAWEDRLVPLACNQESQGDK